MAFTSSAVWEVEVGGLDDFQAVSATPAAGGTGYTNGDVLTLSGGTNTTPATFTAVVSGGIVQSVTPLNTGHYTVLPANPVSVTGGSGTSCTLTVTWNAGGNGGGFDPGVAGFDNTASIASANTASPVVTITNYSFVAGDVGAWFYVKSGTNTIPGWYKIVSVGSGPNSATLDGTIGHCPLATGTLNTTAGCGSAASLTSVTWGIDYSQSTTPRFTSSALSTQTANTNLKDASNTVGFNWVGNVINIVGGASWVVQRVAVTGYSAANTWVTVDKTLGGTSLSGGVGNLGGALGSPGMASGTAAASNPVWTQSGTYGIITATQNVPGGCIYCPGGTGSAWQKWEGYQTVRGDMGTRPLFSSSVAISDSIFKTSGTNYVIARNLSVQGLSTAYAQYGFNVTTNGLAQYCTAKYCTYGYDMMTFCCLATSCTTGFYNVTAWFCEATSCTTGFQAVTTCAWCIARGNSGPGFNASGAAMFCVNCVSAGNTGDGFGNFSNYQNSILINCIAEGNHAYGVNDSNNRTVTLINCAAYNNTSGSVNAAAGQLFQYTLIAYLATAFVDAAGGNFALNNNNPGGAQLRAAGTPGLSPDGLSQGYLDIGAFQHQDPASMIMARVRTGF